MHQEESETLLVSPEEEGMRLDLILAKRYREVKSRSYFQRLIKDHFVLVNGEPVKKRVQPKPGDEVEIFFALTPEIDLAPEPIPLEILYEDDDLLVINKKASFVVHPAPGNWSGTFVNALLYHCRKLDPSGTLRPGIVHRLDKDTTGVLVAAKNSPAQQRLIEQFSQRKVSKEYLAICLGNPKKQKIDRPIARHPVDRKKMAVREGGREAVTYVDTLASDGKLSVVRVEIVTGRTHQIRVHLKEVGTPVLGDPLYGNTQSNRKRGAKRQMLHARKLSLTHPVTEEPLLFEAPIPEEMQAYITQVYHETT